MPPALSYDRATQNVPPHVWFGVSAIFIPPGTGAPIRLQGLFWPRWVLLFAAHLIARDRIRGIAPAFTPAGPVQTPG